MARRLRCRSGRLAPAAVISRAVADPGQDRLRAEQLRPCSRELDGQRQSSSARQIAATTGPVSTVRPNPGRTRRACRTKSWTAGDCSSDAGSESVGTDNGGTANSCSPRTCSGSPGRGDHAEPGGRAEQPSDDAVGRVELFEVVEHEHDVALGEEVRDRLARRRRSSPRRPRSRRWTAHMPCRARRRRPAARSRRRPGSRGPAARASSTPRLVFPAPPGPVSVTSRAPPSTMARTASISVVAPEQRGVGERERARRAQRAQRREARGRAPSMSSW